MIVDTLPEMDYWIVGGDFNNLQPSDFGGPVGLRSRVQGHCAWRVDGVGVVPFCRRLQRELA